MFIILLIRGEKVTNNWLLDGEYQLESRGALYNADIHVKTPFDPANNRYDYTRCLSEVISFSFNYNVPGYKATMMQTRSSWLHRNKK